MAQTSSYIRWINWKTSIKSRQVNLDTNSKEIKTIEPKARVY